jgi:signal transduction histidine kinase
METLRLLVTELVTNSVRHADARTVGMSVQVTDPAVRAEVVDEGPGFEPESDPASARRNGAGGWGLLLVERLADRWGVEHGPRSTRVWFELSRP